MDLNLTGKRPTFRQSKPHSSPYRVLVWLILLVSSLFLLRSVQTKEIKPLFYPTAVPTRTSPSFALEGETHFTSGNLPAAIVAYQKAADLDPTNATLLAELARIQVYSSATLTTSDEKAARLTEALTSINKAVELANDNSTVAATHAFVLDWNSNPDLSGSKSEALLTEAETEAVRAINLDNQNALALAYYAEILVDQKKWLQANQYIKQAVDYNPNLMDVHRVNALVQETLGNYDEAIKEYQKAAEINPNLTFLYISIGTIYRHLQQYDRALEFFSTAVRINDQIGVKDPIPYVAIGKTYTQMGEFFAAAQNMRKALQYNPYSPDMYGQLGIVYFKSRNYEGAIDALRCAIRGCDAALSCSVRKCDSATDPAITIKGMTLDSTTVVYYYSFGSVLAGMHRPTEDKCTEAVGVLGEVRDAFSNDPTVISIVKASEDICASYDIYRQK
jgi:tetratricopeptide (TPR) repeat protein